MKRAVSRDKAAEFARGPKWVGASLLAAGLLLVIVGFSMHGVSPVVWIAGSAMASVGLFAFVFGVLVQVANTSPRQAEGESES